MFLGIYSSIASILQALALRLNNRLCIRPCGTTGTIRGFSCLGLEYLLEPLDGGVIPFHSSHTIAPLVSFSLGPYSLYCFIPSFTFSRNKIMTWRIKPNQIQPGAPQTLCSAGRRCMWLSLGMCGGPKASLLEYYIGSLAGGVAM